MNRLVQKYMAFFQRNFGWAILLGIASMLGIVTLSIFNLNQEHHQASQHAEVEVENISLLMKENTSATVQKVDLLLREIQRDVAPQHLRGGRGAIAALRHKLHPVLKSQVDSDPEVTMLRISDANGNFLDTSYDSFEQIANINIADREYFTRQRDNAAAGLVISAPLLARTTGKWTVILSRRINFEDGSFAGIASAVLNMDYFQRFYRSLNLGPHGVLALFDKDFHLAARSPSSDEEMGKVINTPAKKFVEQGISHSTYLAHSPIDNIGRTVSFRTVDSLPLIVIAGIAEDDYLAAWHRHVWLYGIGSILFGLIMMGIAFFQQRTEIALRASEKYLLDTFRALKLLSSANTTLVRSDNEQELLAKICRIAIDKGGYRLAWIGYAWNDSARTVRPMARSGYDDGYIDNANVTWDESAHGQGPIGTAIRNKITVVVQDFAVQPETAVWREAALKRGYKSSIALPLVIDEKVIGALAIYAGDAGVFGHEEVKLLEELAEDLAYGIKALRVHLEHEQSQLALKKESEKNLALLRNASDGIHILDEEGHVIEASDSFCAMLGYPREQVIGMHVSQWDATYKQGESDAVVKQFFTRHERSQFETIHRRSNGTLFDAEISSFLLELEGRKVLFCSSRDITEHKQAVKDLRDSNQEMASLLNSMAEGAYGIDTEGKCTFVNQAFLRILGYETASELIGMHIHELIHHSYADGKPYPASACRMYAVYGEGRETHATDEVLWRKDGTAVPIEFWSQPIVLDNMPQGAIVTFIDITDRKKSEHETRIAATAFETQEGMLITDANLQILRVNRAFTEITGYTLEEIIGKTPRILNSGQHDAAFYKAMWDSIASHGNWAGVIWNRRKNGEIYPEHLSITAVTDSNGTVINYVGSFNDTTMQMLAEEKIQHLAFYDQLTNLPNRRLLQDRLQRALSSSRRSSRYGALLMIDLDNFKTLNDTLGHDKGDHLLRQVAERLLSCVREGDSVARLGGDEFVIVLTELSNDPPEAAAQTEFVGLKILRTLNQTYHLTGDKFHCTSSIGATLFLDKKQEIEDLLKQADIAMYQAKKEGRNAFRFFDQNMQLLLHQRMSLEAELRKAIDGSQFRLYYQIQVDHKQRTLGAEALIRWEHPERGLISPAEFIPVAEETGLIYTIGWWVLKTACTQIEAWQNDIRTRKLVLSVNVSAYQFRKADFVEQVKAAMQLHDVNPTLLKLELTEGMLLTNVDSAITTMFALRDYGVGFSLDDFGTGYSSLQYLKRLPLTQLKIDQSFVRDLEFDSSDEAIVRTIIAMAKSLNLDVIAEGVETEEQQAILQQNGCNHYQGYLYSKPVPIEQFEQLLMRVSDVGRSVDDTAMLLRLNWHKVYECGEHTIDQEHRELFERANALIESAFAQDANPKEFDVALDKLIAHITKNFADEEAILALHNFADLDNHKIAHKTLLDHALQLRSGVAEDQVTLGELVDFIANEVILQHMLNVDRQFYTLFDKAQ
jgi:diguanylate cyclase (GGDEF)-like protein/hemerythrin-like metal-binding protein/PAS domain S-box-containing protein